MKKLLTIIVLFTACRKNTDPIPSYNLGVSMLASFQQDEVTIYIDDQVLFAGTVSTDADFSMAKSISTTASKGTHLIKVIVNGEVMGMDQFSLNNALFVGVGYDKAARKVSFNYASYN